MDAIGCEVGSQSEPLIAWIKTRLFRRGCKNVAGFLKATARCSRYNAYANRA